MITASIALVFLGLNAFTLQGLPWWNVRSDQVIFLANAQRMLQGEQLYGDIFHILPPGSELAYMAALAAFGAKPWIPGAAYVALGLVQLFAMLKIATRVGSGWMGAAAALAYLAAAYQDFDVVHHWFSATWLLLALALVVDRRSAGRLALSGACLGLAAATTPTRGVLGVIAFVVFVLYEEWLLAHRLRDALRKSAILIAAFAATLLAVLAPFARAVGLERLGDCLIVYVTRNYFLDDRYNNWVHTWAELRDLTTPPAYLGGLLSLSMYFVPVVLLLALLFIAARWRQRHERRVFVLLAIVGCLQLLAVAPYPSALRLAAMSAPSFILLGAMVEAHPPWRKPAFALVALVVLAAMVVQPLRRAAQPSYAFESRIGPVAFRSEAAREPYAWLKQASRPGDFAFDSGSPDFYYLLQLRNPTAYPFVAPNAYTTARQVDEILASLERARARFVIWPASQMTAMRGDPLPPLREHLRRCYSRVASFKERDYEMWERQDRWADAACPLPQGGRALDADVALPASPVSGSARQHAAVRRETAEGRDR